MARHSVVKGYWAGGGQGKQQKGSEFVFRTHCPPWDTSPPGVLPLVHFLRMEESHVVVVGRDRATELLVSERLRGPPKAPPAPLSSWPLSEQRLS